MSLKFVVPEPYKDHMTSRAKLKPKYEKKEAWRAKRYRLSIPPVLSPTGKRQKLWFATPEEAEEAAEIYQNNRDNATAPLRLYKEWSLAAQITLPEVLKAGMDWWDARFKSVTFKTLVDETLAAKGHLSGLYHDRLQYVANQFESLNDKLVSDIAPLDLEPIFNKLRNRRATYNSAVRHLKVFFSYGKSLRYLQENPVSGRPIIGKAGKEVEVIPLSLVAPMLQDALDNERELLPYLIFGFFCGIRPGGELLELNWKQVDFEEEEITVTSKASKTWQTRHVKISDNAMAWLEAYRQAGGKTDASEPIVPFTKNQLRDKRRNSWKRISGGAEWVQDGMRHTFASHHYAMHKDVNEVCSQLGHTSPQMFNAHYRKGVKLKEAQEFWNIRPASNKPKLLQFPAA
jgi:integrase